MPLKTKWINDFEKENKTIRTISKEQNVPEIEILSALAENPENVSTILEMPMSFMLLSKMQTSWSE